MNKLRAAVNAIDDAAVIIAEVVLIALMVMLFVSITGRALFHWSIPDRSIFTEMMMVAIVFLVLGHAQRLGVHIEVTAITKLMPPKVNEAFRVFALLLGIVIMGGATWFSALTAYDAYVAEDYIYASILYLVEWPSRALVPLGLGWWTLRMVLQMLILEERYDEVDHIEERLNKFGCNL